MFFLFFDVPIILYKISSYSGATRGEGLKGCIHLPEISSRPQYSLSSVYLMIYIIHCNNLTPTRNFFSSCAIVVKLFMLSIDKFYRLE